MRQAILALSSVAMLGLATPSAGLAQEVFVPPVTTANPGGYANPLKLDTDRYDRERRAKQKARNAPRARPASEACSADAVPVADRRRIESEYARRARVDGKASADIWVREEGLRYRMKMVKQGVCPAPTAAELTNLRQWRSQQKRTTASGRKAGETAKSDRGKKGCKMVMRPVAGFGGAMTMAMVPDCS